MSYILNYEEFINENYHPPALLDNATDIVDRPWIRPNSAYSNRGWIQPNYQNYQNIDQTHCQFQIGDAVQCIDRRMQCFAASGKIVAFEDNTIRFEVESSATGVGQTAKQYRCAASSLKKII